MADRTPRKLSPRKRLAFSAVTLVVSYAIAEAACTAYLPISPGVTGSHTFAVVENKGGFCFDPILGYRISKTPARFTRVIQGVVEYVGCFQGNAQGFQGTKDFTIQKPPGVKWRALVLGDSFTSAAFLNASWTSRVEEKRPDCELLNCAVDGAGLANWWSILTRFMLPQNYECDEVVIASIENDLVRRFVAGQSNEAGIMLGYFPWDPPSYPCSLAETSPNSFRLTYSQLKNFEFDNSLRERRLCYGPNPHKVRRPWIAARIGRLLADHFWSPRAALTPCEPREKVEHAAALPKTAATHFFNAEQMALIFDMRDRLKSRKLPVTVIYIPSRDELLKSRDDSPKVRAFAEYLGARFIDGSEPYRKLDADEIRACYFPHDAHWNQVGSDRFADFVAERLK